NSYTEKDISQFHWTNGLPPTEDESPEWLEAHENNWSDWSLHVGGDMIDHSVTLSLDELKALPKREYIATHTCMQGWSATSKWAGTHLKDILALLGPKPESANYVMITSHGLAQEMIDHRPREPFYAVIDLATLDEEDTVLS